MKKILVMILTAAMIAAAFIGCAQKPSFGSSSADTNGNGLRDDVEAEILKGYHKKHKLTAKFNEKDFQLQYYGTFNGAIAYRIWHKATPYTVWTYTDIIGGIEFVYERNNKIQVWYNGAIYTLQEMYDQGILTTDDLAEINAEYVKQPEHKLTW